MKIRLSELRSLIREEIKQLGRYAFGDERVHSLPEPDTDIERDTFRQLSKQIMWSANMSPESVAVLKAGLADGSYDDVLKPPAIQTVYRGMLLSKDEAVGLLQGLGVSSEVATELEGDEATGGTYAPRKNADSWTNEPGIAYRFATASVPPGKRTIVILVADVAENHGVFLSGPDGFYNLMTLRSKSEENEVLALGPVRISRVVWSTLGKTSSKMKDFISI